MESFIGSFVCFGGALEDRFVIDSGATSHMVKDINLLDDYETLSKPLQVEIGDKTKIVAIARGEWVFCEMFFMYLSLRAIL